MANRGKPKGKWQEHERMGVLRYIVHYKKMHDGNSPSIREIMQACRICSTNTVYLILRELESSELITMPDGRGRTRGIQIVGGYRNFEG